MSQHSFEFYKQKLKMHYLIVKHRDQKEKNIKWKKIPWTMSQTLHRNLKPHISELLYHHKNKRFPTLISLLAICWPIIVYSRIGSWKNEMIIIVICFLSTVC